jgi:Ca-activated chloride channel family protein
VQLRYTQLLAASGEALQFRYAGGIQGSRPRPFAAPAREGRPDHDDDHRRDDHDGPVLTDFEMVVEDGDAYLDPFSPTHGLDRTRRNGRLVIRLEDELTGELSVFLPLASSAVGLTLAAHHPAGEDGYMMLTLTPGLMDEPAEPRDLTAVVDVSGSMAGEKIAQARAALHALLATLEPADRFRLIAFSNAVRVQREEWQAADEAALRAAGDWIERLDADGGTNIAGALEEAFRVPPGEGRLPVVIFVTDGLPTVGEQNAERIAAAAERDRGRARVFAFGVGNDVNTHLLDGLSAAARGSTDYVQPGESVERALSLLAAKIRHPVLTDLELAGAPAQLREIYPVTLPDLFAGQELVLLARYRGEGEGQFVVRGRRAGRTEAYTMAGALPHVSDANEYLPRLWASRKLGHLTRQVLLEGPSQSLLDEIKETALRYGLPSEYTAYLVTEPDMVAVGNGGARREAAMFTAPPSSPQAATGAGAVASAARAGQLRDAVRAAEVNAVAEELEARLAGQPDRRLVGGRLFQLREGVWAEVTPTSSDRLPVLTVKLFSRAWFDLVAALPEVAPAARELGRVELAGTRVRLRFDETGLDELAAARVAGVVAEFRGVD